MKKLSISIFFLSAILLNSCEKKDILPERSTRLKSYLLSYDNSEERKNFWNTYIFDSENRVSKIVQNDTTFNKLDNQYTASSTTTEYTFNGNGFLTERKRKHLSIAQTWNTVVTYQYNTAGLLSLEDRGNRILEYRYNNKGELTQTINSILWNGSKIVVEYNDDIPAQLQSDGNGYFVEEIDENTYFNSNLNITKIERFKDGELIFEKIFEYADGTSPLAALPSFKGFPKIKSFAYRDGIENSIEVYQIENGNRILTDNRKATSLLNMDGYIVESNGTDEFNLDKPQASSLLLNFQFFYEEY